MTILELDLATHDIANWDTRINQARKTKTPLPFLQDISPYGQLFFKIVRYTGEDEDRLLQEVVVYSADEKGELIPGTEQPIEQPCILVRSQISDANIQVGSKQLRWQETFR